MITASNSKPWMSDEYDMSVLENEEMWSQRVIDEAVKDLFDEIEQDENNVSKKEKE